MSNSELEVLVGKIGSNPEWITDVPAKLVAMDRFLDKEEVPNAGEVYERLKQFASTKLGFTVTDSGPWMLEPEVQGETRFHQRQIFINPDLGIYRKAITLAHELAHTAHGPTRMSELVIEVFAESVSFLVAHELGWPTDEMAAYLTRGSQGFPIEMKKLIRTMAPFSLEAASTLMEESGLVRMNAQKHDKAA